MSTKFESIENQMKKLLDTGKYNAGKRPSEYDIGEKSFSIDNVDGDMSESVTYDETLLQFNYNRLQIPSNNEKLEPKYHDHLLIGKLSGFRGCHIQPD